MSDNWLTYEELKTRWELADFEIVPAYLARLFPYNQHTGEVLNFSGLLSFLQDRKSRHIPVKYYRLTTTLSDLDHLEKNPQSKIDVEGLPGFIERLPDFFRFFSETIHWRLSDVEVFEKQVIAGASDSDSRSVMDNARDKDSSEISFNQALKQFVKRVVASPDLQMIGKPRSTGSSFSDIDCIKIYKNRYEHGLSSRKIALTMFKPEDVPTGETWSNSPLRKKIERAVERGRKLIPKHNRPKEDPNHNKVP